MTKTEATKLFGGNVSLMGRQIGVTRGAIRKWPEELPLRLENQVIGGHIRYMESVDQKAVIEMDKGDKQ